MEGSKSQKSFSLHLRFRHFQLRYSETPTPIPSPVSPQSSDFHKILGIHSGFHSEDFYVSFMAIGWFQWTQFSLNPNKFTLFNDFYNKSFIIKVNTVLRNFVLASTYT